VTFNSGINNPTIQAVLSPVQMEQKQKALFNDRKRKIIVLAGPTGVGKTALSLQIARVIGGEIVSADSMQVYRGLDIGTAKVRIEERGSIRHHLIDGKDIDETFNVVDFYHEAQQAFQEIFARDHVPIVVGGTGFYIHALIYGPPQGPPSVPEIRTGLELQMEQYGPLKLYEQLKKVDPEYAGSITSFDRHKIIRALEIIYLTGQKVSSFQKKAVPLPEFDFRCWFLYKPKEILYPLLEKRCDKMIADGFLEEVKKLEKQGL
jgi:tRNA dimethylallyltransferase